MSDSKEPVKIVVNQKVEHFTRAECVLLAQIIASQNVAIRLNLKDAAELRTAADLVEKLRPYSEPQKSE